MKKTVLVFGSIAGAIVSAFMAVSMIVTGCNPEFEGGSMALGFASMIVAFAFIFVGIKSYRDKYLGGAISFGKAFKAGFLIALLASTMYVVTWAVVYNFVMPDFMEKYSAMVIRQAEQKGATAEMLKAETEKMASYAEMYRNPVWWTLFTYMEILPVGIIVALVSSLILKKKGNLPV